MSFPSYDLIMLALLVFALGLLSSCISLGFSIASFAALFGRPPRLEAGRRRAVVALVLTSLTLIGLQLFVTICPYSNARRSGIVWFITLPPLAVAALALLTWNRRSSGRSP